MDKGEQTGLVFDILRFALHDGPGIRTLVFMKGCPLSCDWCSNPESQRRDPEVMIFGERCIECWSCIEACPSGEKLRDIWPRTNGECSGCGSCVAVCYSEARELVGRSRTVDDVLAVVLRDRIFYEESGGGLTVGGGEPTFQPDFVAALLGAAQQEGIHTALETCGAVKWDTFQKVLDSTNLLLMDIKHMDSATHRARTGVGNEIILKNAKLASRCVQEMVVRLPLIPACNEDPENIHSLGEFITSELEDVQRVDILPYHSMGASKAKRLGRSYPVDSGATLTQEDISRTRAILESYGLQVNLGG